MRKIINALLLVIISCTTPLAFGMNVYLVDNQGRQLSNNYSVEINIRAPAILGETSSHVREIPFGCRITIYSGKAFLPDPPKDQAYRLVVRNGNSIVAGTRLFNKNQLLPSDRFMQNGIVLDPISTTVAATAEKK